MNLKKDGCENGRKTDRSCRRLKKALAFFVVFWYYTNRCFLDINTPAEELPPPVDYKPARRFKRMAKCEFCDKGVVFGIQVSHSHRRSNRPWKPNVKRVKAIVNGTPKHVYVCTHCLRSGKVTRAV